MKTNFISLQDIVEEWIEDNGYSFDEFKIKVLKRQASSVVKLFNTTEQLSHKIVLLTLENGKVRKPKGFKILNQIAYRIPSPENECITRERLTKWVQRTHDPKCELEININCQRCHKSNCECKSEGATEIQVDRLWMAINPWYYHLSKYAKPGQFGYGHSIYSPQFKLLKPSQNDLFNLHQHIPNCTNFKCSDSCEYSYKIGPEYIDIDIDKKGTEILISYLSETLDEHGDILVPDHEDAVEAIKHQLDYWNGKRLYNSESDRLMKRELRSSYQEAYQLRELSIARARSALSQLSFKDTWQMLENVFAKRVPQFDLEGRLNHNLQDYASEWLAD